MNTNFEGILPVGFPVDAPYDERYHGFGSLKLQVSVPGANRRWVRVNLPSDAPVIEATTEDSNHSGLPCKYLAVPTYYKGLISWSATQFTPGVPDSLHTVAPADPSQESALVATYQVKTRVTGIKAVTRGGQTTTFAVASAKLTASSLSTYNLEGNVVPITILPTLCSDGLVVWSGGNDPIYSQASFADITTAALPSSVPSSPVDVALCPLARRELRPADGLVRFGMLFSLNIALWRLNTATVQLAPALFSNPIAALVDDTEGIYDGLRQVIDTFPIAMQAEAGAAAPAAVPQSGTDVSGIVQKLGTMEISLASLTSLGAIRTSLDTHIPQISNAIFRVGSQTNNILGWIESQLSWMNDSISSNVV